METPEVPKLNLANEIKKVRELLGMPITNIEFDPRYEYGRLYRDDEMNFIIMVAKLYVNDDMVGTMPYTSGKHGFIYNIENSDITPWEMIDKQVQQLIFDRILHQEPRAVSVEQKEYHPQKSLILNIKDKDGTLINGAGCVLIGGEWNVYVTGLNPVTKKVSVSVTLKPPPSPGATDIKILPR